jgi:hypothetical protein
LTIGFDKLSDFVLTLTNQIVDPVAYTSVLKLAGTIPDSVHSLREKKVAWWDDTGTGKTQTAIALADAIEANNILVLCPVIALEHWKAQFAKHGRVDRSVELVRGLDLPLLTNVIVVPFSLISKYPNLAKRLRQYRFDLVVIDEAHALMSMDRAHPPITRSAARAAACRRALCRLLSV